MNFSSLKKTIIFKHVALGRKIKKEHHRVKLQKTSLMICPSLVAVHCHQVVPKQFDFPGTFGLEVWGAGGESYESSETTWCESGESSESSAHATEDKHLHKFRRSSTRLADRVYWLWGWRPRLHAYHASNSLSCIIDVDNSPCTYLIMSYYASQ